MIMGSPRVGAGAHQRTASLRAYKLNDPLRDFPDLGDVTWGDRSVPSGLRWRAGGCCPRAAHWLPASTPQMTQTTLGLDE